MSSWDVIFHHGFYYFYIFIYLFYKLKFIRSSLSMWIFFSWNCYTFMYFSILNFYLLRVLKCERWLNETTLYLLGRNSDMLLVFADSLLLGLKVISWLGNYYRVSKFIFFGNQIIRLIYDFKLFGILDKRSLKLKKKNLI